MFHTQSAQIMAMIRSGKMINIGGRPVIVPKPRQPATAAHDRGLAIQLALAFVAIYVDLGMAARISPDEATMGGGICVGLALLSSWARDAALGGAVCGLGTGSTADCDRADVHTRAGVDDGSAADQPAERAGTGVRRCRRGDVDRSGIDGEGVQSAGIAGGVARIFVLVVGGGGFAAAQAAF